MKLRGETYFLMAIAAMMLIAMWSLLQIKQVYAKFVPLILSSTVFILTAVATMKSISPKTGAEMKTSQDDTDDTEELGSILRGYLAAGSWTVGFFLAIYLLGLTIALGLFVFAYTKLHGTGWLLSIILTVSIIAFAYGLFEVGLHVPLYKGLLFSV